MTSLRSKETDLDRDPEKGSPIVHRESEPDLYNSTRQGDISYREDKETSAAASTKQAVISECETLDQISGEESEDPEPPPDGGWQAWSVCICAHIVLASTWGFVNSFGIFQAYYTDFLELQPSQISWIGAMQTFLAFFLSTFTGRISDAGYFHHVFLAGSFLQVFGVFMTSLCTRYWQLMLAQGVCIGVAAAFLCCPIMSVSTTYFQKRRSLAIGIMTCGNITGGLIFPAMARQLLPTIGFAWSLRAVGLIQLVLLAGCNLVAKTRVLPNRSGPLIELGAFKELEFTFYCVGMFFNLSGTYIAYYYAASFGRTGITPRFSYPDSLNLLLIMNGIGIIGRLGGATLADRVGPLNMMIPCALAGSVCCLAWTAVHTRPQMYGWASIYGIPGGALQSLFPAGITMLTSDVRKTGLRMGMCFTIVGFSVLAGPPVAGALVERMGGQYAGTQVYAGLNLLVGGIFVGAARWVRTGGKLLAKI